MYAHQVITTSYVYALPHGGRVIRQQQSALLDIADTAIGSFNFVLIVDYSNAYQVRG